jgi:hypothetical protein
MVKSAKQAIYGVLGNNNVTDEELITTFSGAESLINLRPLTYQTADPTIFSTGRWVVTSARKQK